MQTVYELAQNYYPRLWDKSRLEALVQAGRLTQEECQEITGETEESAVSADDMEAMTISQLKSYAQERGIILSGKTLKADMIAAIQAAL